MIELTYHIMLEDRSTRRHNCSGTHHQDNHAGNIKIEEVINLVKMWAIRVIFFDVSRWGKP